MLSTKKLIRTVLNENVKIFVIYIAFLLIIYLVRIVLIAFLLIKKIKILNKYSDYTNIFLKKKAVVLPKIIN